MILWCIWPDCNTYCKSFRALEQHVVDVHGAKPAKPKKEKSGAKQ